MYIVVSYAGYGIASFETARDAAFFQYQEGIYLETKIVNGVTLLDI